MISFYPGWETLAKTCQPRNVTSQWGEDGLIAGLFAAIGTRNHWCFEVGAADGLYFSNTKILRDAGWNAVLIEADPTLYEMLWRYESPAVQCVYATLTADNLDTILAHAGAPADLDLGVIDIDGGDYWVWEGLREHRPRVVLIEFGDWNASDHVCPREDWRTEQQTSRNPLLALGKSKGYRPVCECGYNLIFVRGDA